jgi:hypothetical protein
VDVADVHDEVDLRVVVDRVDERGRRQELLRGCVWIGVPCRAVYTASVRVLAEPVLIGVPLPATAVTATASAATTGTSSPIPFVIVPPGSIGGRARRYEDGVGAWADEPFR